jgi:hypothetical protein
MASCFKRLGAIVENFHGRMARKLSKAFVTQHCVRRLFTRARAMGILEAHRLSPLDLPDADNVSAGMSLEPLAAYRFRSGLVFGRVVVA